MKTNTRQFLSGGDPGTGSSPSKSFSSRPPKLLVLVSVILWSAVSPVTASDHSDVPEVGGLIRQDANLTDLHTFVVGNRLVLALSSNPAIPPSAAGYRFPTDLTFEINIDNDSRVSPEDPYRMGGTILDPDKIHEDVTFRIRFANDGTPNVKTFVRGRKGPSIRILNFFAGLRDDPFIRGPRTGRNVASIVLEVPLASVIRSQSTLLIWATSKVEDAEGPFQDLAGRTLRSMMPENTTMNLIQPRQQARRMGVPPDVVIYDTARPAAYPNGRALTDDVVDLVGDPRILANDAPFPTQNDVPFPGIFPYLAPPHPPR
jgi:hypothetical protein